YGAAIFIYRAKAHKMAGPEATKVLNMLWKQAAIGSSIGLVVAVSYYQAVCKNDTKKVADYYAKQEQAAGSK
ncbi:hypothetical protein, partial [Salmonella sp. s58408]|uniref:hypothetical protein n=1 Tax=Salmonella sp. s58408 TaxID=3159701 RepID=UPI00397FE01B